MQVDAKELLKKAKREKRALAAINVSTLETIEAVFQAANAEKSEVIIETSGGEVGHLTPQITSALCQKFSEIYEVDYVLHLDRGNEIELMRVCLEAGYNSLSADFHLPFAENIEITKRVRELTDKHGAQLEGALDYVPVVGYAKMKAGELKITDPEKVQEFVEATGVDSLVVSIGTQSGKFKDIQEIRYDVLEKVNQLLPELPLVLHGGSFLDKEIIIRAINNGVAKINVNSELRLAYTSVLKENLAKNPEEYAPYRLLTGIKPAMQMIAQAKISLFKNS